MDTGRNTDRYSNYILSGFQIGDKMRICIEKVTGKLIEMQSDATAGTLLQNAIASGYLEQDIEEREITADEWRVFKDYKPLDKVKVDKISEINAQAQSIILARYPLWVQSNCANGIYPAAFATQMKADIAAVITASNTATDAVTAAINEAGVNSVIAVWPVI